ncbi:transcriptional regulator [Rhodobacteraceae bacterium RKSG542]|uniref:ArsR/SmtB family transcription factor n=1 Tax=Pseudovibrio flavus TaxID=2529854 RepID=UPI0012BBCFEA|nr:metalloregulator ArsR/SmtB family transcription factor [Pseudovibrio flavus]MTI18540.1 transcriptional regulator [Pseudovibrio flavus]
MELQEKMDLSQMEPKAEAAAELLSSMAHPKRLLVLCTLLGGECSVGHLVEITGLSQSALSQHLAKMRASELVTTRRSAQTIYYSLASHEVEQILQTLYQLYCAPQTSA